jgi:hypothetical protein
MYINRNTYSNLPENWSEHISRSGLPYYYNSITGESHWQHPTINTHIPQTPPTNLQQRMQDNPGLQGLQDQVMRTLGIL